MTKAGWKGFVAAALVLASGGAGRCAERAAEGLNDTARFLAGLPVSSGSHLRDLAATPEWRQHAAEMNALWGRFERGRFAQMRAWSASEMRRADDGSRALWYPFSGPDFAHAWALFPNAPVYLMAALEPVGPIPDPSGLSRRDLAASLAQLRKSIGTAVNYSYFITKDMKVDLRSGSFLGVMPLLSLFLARSGCAITDVAYVSLDASGEVRAGAGDGGGVRLRFRTPGGGGRTLFYFATDLSDGRLDGDKRYLRFVEGHGRVTGFLKAASYLLHSGGFGQMRRAMLRGCGHILQDDSGLPFRAYDPGQWHVRLYGRFSGTLDMFREYYQADLAAAYERGGGRPLPFGAGYKWKDAEGYLLLAERRGGE